MRGFEYVERVQSSAQMSEKHEMLLESFILKPGTRYRFICQFSERHQCVLIPNLMTWMIEQNHRWTTAFSLIKGSVKRIG
jgi:hypothetical protein